MIAEFGAGAARAGDAVLRGCGGGRAFVRIPLPPVAGDAQEELGAASPTLQEHGIEPAVFRRTTSTGTLLASATALESLAGSSSAASVQFLLMGAAGIRVGANVFLVKSVNAMKIGNRAMCYSIELEPVCEGK